MSGKLTRDAYEKLITENIEAMKLVKSAFVASNIRLEWEHIIAVLKASPEREYGDHKECLEEIERLKKKSKNLADNLKHREGLIDKWAKMAEEANDELLKIRVLEDDDCECTGHYLCREHAPSFGGKP